MSKWTEISQAPTNFTQKDSEGGASSCMVDRKREMFQPLNATNSQTVNPKHLIQQNSIQLIPRNVLIMNPIHAKSIVWPQIFMPDQELSISLKGNFYSIKDSRNKQRFINRNSMPKSQVVHFNVSKNQTKLVISSVERFVVKNEDQMDQLWYHFDIAVFNIENETIQKMSSVERGFAEVSSLKTAVNLAVKFGEKYYLDFKGMQLIDNNKKAFAVFEPIGLERNRYEVIMIDFHKTKDAEDSYSSISEIKESKKFMKHNLQTKRVGTINLERKQTEVYKKLINSEFGDIVLLITSHEIYEIQIAGQLRQNEYTLILKPFQICKIFSENKNTYVSNQTNQLVLSKQMFSKEQKIIDASYVMNGLKIMILTSHGRVFVVESEQCIFSESLYEMLSTKEMVLNYNIEYFVFKNLYFLRGLLVVEVEAEKKQDCNLIRQPKYEDSILDRLDERKNTLEYVSRGLIIAKVQSNSLSFNKFISLPFHLTNYDYLKVHPFMQADELLIQVLSQKDSESLELHKCQIISNRNSFIPFSMVHLNREPKIVITNSVSISSVIERQLDTKGSSKVAFGKSNKSFYVLKGNEVSGYRVHNNEFVSVVQNGIQKTLSASFFQKPQKIITNPLTGQVVILFREFIKFFMSVYSELNLQFVMNMREVKDINFSKLGESLIICLNDNSIILIDSYRFTEKKVMEFYGDVKQVNHATEYIMTIRSCRNVLNIFRKREQPILTNNGKNNSETLEFYQKLYDIKLESEDLYYVDETLTIIMKKDGSIQIYSHVPESRSLKKQVDEKEMIIFNLLSKEHPHLINKKKISLQKSEYPTYCFFSCSFSTLFVGTSHGNIKQFLYPFLSIEDPSPPECYTYPAANNQIVHIELNADFSSLYAATELGQVLELKFEQFLNGQKKNGIYLVSKIQSFQSMIKYEFANRNYLIDDYTPTNEQLKMFMLEQYEEICFADDKIKNEIEDTTSKIKSESAKLINGLSQEKKTVEKAFRNEFNNLSCQMKDQEKIITEHIEDLQARHEKQKNSLIDQNEKELLDIYRQSDRLSYILSSKTSEYAQNASQLRKQLNQILEKQIALKEEETRKLEEEYKQLEEKYKIYSNVASDQVNQNQIQLENYKHQEIGKIEDKLKTEELKKQSELSRMGKIEKEIERYKKRSIYFENLIVETRNQIEQLNNDVLLYKEKKTSLIKELQEKQSTIEEKQTQLVKYLKTTNEMKKIKNVHQFQLNQFEGDLVPIQDKILQLQKQVQNTNNEIMEQFNSKLEQDSCIDNSRKRIEKLKTNNYLIVENLLKSRTQLLRFTEVLTAVLNEDPFAPNTRKKLAKMVDNFSKECQVFVGNEEIERAKKYGLNLIRKKNMLNKAIERQEKLEEGIVRNKNQFFRFYSDNTNLVKEYNELFKDHNTLMKEKSILLEKINALKASTYQTPLKRTASLHIRKVSEKKLTPFQRYEQEQIQFNTIKLKQGDTTETRVSRGESSSFLKSLIKDVSIAENNFEKSNMVRERIRTFVNPEMQRKTIQKQLFQKERERGKSNHVPLLKL